MIVYVHSDFDFDVIEADFNEDYHFSVVSADDRDYDNLQGL
jgi:hypothetical protein